MSENNSRFKFMLFSSLKEVIVFSYVWLLLMTCFSEYKIDVINKWNHVIVIGIIAVTFLFGQILKLIYDKLKNKGLLIIHSGILLLIILKGGWIYSKILAIIEESLYANDSYYDFGRIEIQNYWALVSICIFGFALVLWFLSRSEKTRYMYIAGGAVLYGLWFTGGADSVEKYVVPVCAVAVGYYLSQKLIENEGKLEKDEKSPHVFALIRLTVIILLCVFFMPRGMYGHDILGINNLVYNKYAPGNGEGAVKYSDVYRYAYANVDGKKKLGGAIKQGKSELMTLKGEYIPYLKSAVRSSYNGEYWYNTGVEYYKVKKTDEILGEYDDYEVVGDKRTTIKYDKKLDTKTVFYPLNMKNINIERDLYYSKGTGSLLGKGNAIREYSLEWGNIRNNESGKVVPNKFNGLNENWGAIFKYTPFVEEEDLADDELKNNIGKYEKFLKVDENITARTKEKVYELIEGKNSVYDRIRVIEEYLESEFPYTLEVSEVPEGQDFVDYFIFEEKKGYCTYYSTAMAMMARIAGVPSRYCEGFKVDSQRYTLVQGDKKWRVSGENAHAWTEILVDPKEDIWMIVDATPGEEEEEIELVIEDDNKSDGAEKPLVLNNDREMKPMMDEEDLGGGGTGKRENLIDVTFLVILIAVCFMLKVMHRGAKNYSVARSDKPDKIFKYALKNLKWVRIIKKEEESEMEFAQRIEDDELKNIMVNIVRNGYAASYGEKVHYCSKDDYKAVNNYVKKRLNLFKYVFIRFIL